VTLSITNRGCLGEQQRIARSGTPDRERIALEGAQRGGKKGGYNESKFSRGTTKKLGKTFGTVGRGENETSVDKNTDLTRGTKSDAFRDYRGEKGGFVGNAE